MRTLPALPLLLLPLCLSAQTSEFERRLAQRQADAQRIQQQMRGQASQGNNMRATTPLVDPEDAPPSAMAQQAAIQAELATMSQSTFNNLNAEAQGNPGAHDMQALLRQHMAASTQMTSGTFNPQAGQTAYNLDPANRDAFLASGDAAILRETNIPAPDPREGWWDDTKKGKYVFDTQIPMFAFLQKIRHGGDLGLQGKFERFWVPMPLRLHGGTVRLVNLRTNEVVGANSRVTMLLNLYPHPNGKGCRVELFYNTRWVAYRQGFRVWWREVSWPWVKAFIDALLTQLGNTDTVESLRTDLSSVLGRIQALQIEISEAQGTLNQSAQQVAEAQAEVNAATQVLTAAQARLTEAQQAQAIAAQAVASALAEANSALARLQGLQATYQLYLAEAASLTRQAFMLPLDDPSRGFILNAATMRTVAANNLSASIQQASSQYTAAYAAYNTALSAKQTADAAIAPAQQGVDTAQGQLALAQDNLATMTQMDAQIRTTGATFASNDPDQPTVRVDALQAKIDTNRATILTLQSRATELQSRLRALGDPVGINLVAVNQAGSDYIANRNAGDQNADLYRAVIGSAQATQAAAPATTEGSSDAVGRTVLAAGGSAQDAAAGQALADQDKNVTAYGYTNTNPNLAVSTAVTQQYNPTNRAVSAQNVALPPLGGGTGQDVQGGNPDAAAAPPGG